MLKLQRSKRKLVENLIKPVDQSCAIKVPHFCRRESLFDVYSAHVPMTIK